MSDANFRPITPAVPLPTAASPRSSAAPLYRRVRSETEAIAAPLSAEDQTIQSVPNASPAK